ncbi:MAG TPA: hypothetical protein PLO20_15140, partial [Thermogutta sp.]|nr:hypothetical protein [Thermogutta sp.]
MSQRHQFVMVMVTTLLTFALFLALLLVPLPVRAAEFYVSPDGNDANAGTFLEPFASLERAQAALRAFRASDPHSICRIILRDGIYRLEKTIVFQLGDAPVEIVAA